jgi:membrane protein YqaA with SNARE-associated domain
LKTGVSQGTASSNLASSAMSLWLLLTATLLVQEGLSTTVLLLRAYQEHYPLIAIHLIWLVVTVLQIYIGYYLGRWIQKRFKGSKFELWLKKSAHSLEKYIGTSGQALALILVAGVVSPAIAALGASWLEITFTSVLIFALIGDFIWYVSEWATVFGVTHFFGNPVIEIVVVIVGGIIFAIAVQFAKKKKA